MKILFVTTMLPRNMRIGSEVASQAFIEAMSTAGHEVTVLGYMRKGDKFETAPHEKSIGTRYIETTKAGIYPYLWFASSLAKNLPYSCAKYVSRRYVNTLRDITASKQFDIVFLDHSQLAWLNAAFGKRQGFVFIAHNVEHELYKTILESKSNFISRWIYAREARLIKWVESRLVSRATEVWTLTQHDAKAFERLANPHRVRTFSLPARFKVPTMAAVQRQFDIAIFGNWTWQPSVHGLKWFLDEVLPRLPSNFNIRVAGSGAEWLSGRYDNVNYLGFVDDLNGFLTTARAIAIPTLSGGGIQIKTLDAVASGSPIVATTTALRGIDDPPDTVTVADQAEQFAQNLVATCSCSNRLELATDALNWSSKRRKNFYQEIDTALQAIGKQQKPN